MLAVTAAAFLLVVFHEKVVKLFLKFISHFLGVRWDRASIRTRYVGPGFDPLVTAKGGTLLSWCRGLAWSPWRLDRNRSESSVLSLIPRVPPERLPRRAVAGFGGAPHQTGSSHSVEGFIRLTGFPEREEQCGELSRDSDDGSLLGPGCSLLGET
jgi:hypothetical protein